MRTFIRFQLRSLDTMHLLLQHFIKTTTRHLDYFSYLEGKLPSKYLKYQKTECPQDDYGMFFFPFTFLKEGLSMIKETHSQVHVGCISATKGNIKTKIKRVKLQRKVGFLQN